MAAIRKPVEWDLDLHQAHRVLQAIKFAAGQAEVFAGQAKVRGEKDAVISLSSMVLLLDADAVELQAAIKAYADPICQVPKTTPKSKAKRATV